MWSIVPQLRRFCVVGALCLAVTTAGLAALHELAGMYYLAAYAISFCIGNLLGYLLNGRFTFSARVSATGGVRYLVLNSILLALNSLLMKLLVEEAHVWYIGACLVVSAAVTPVSFLLHRKFSYAAPEAYARP
jgi:putative flippase GtrA